CDRRRAGCVVDLGRGLRAAARPCRTRDRVRRPRCGAWLADDVWRGPPGPARGHSLARGRARPRARPGRGRNGTRGPPHVHGDARAARDPDRPRCGATVLGGKLVRIRLGHLYPDYLNIYADRGNLAVLQRRAALRGHELVVYSLDVGDALDPAAHDLLYIGGGQDREQALIAPDLAAKGGAIAAAHTRGVAMLAV